MTKYFHCCALPLSAGSIVCPGNWGRIQKKFGQDPLALLRETILENVRREEFNQAPSRLSSAFLSPTFVAAEMYKSKYGPRNIIYEIELVESEAVVFFADYDVCMQPFVGIEGMEALARNYWSAENIAAPEVLTVSPLRIIRCVDPDVPQMSWLTR